jgi:hypothetical protein
MLRVLLVALLIALASLSCVALTSSADFSSPPFAEKVLAVAPVAIAVIAVLLLIAFILQWRAFLDQGKWMRDAAESATKANAFTEHCLRAYAAIDGLPVREVAPGMTFPLTFKNFGQTAAHDVLTWQEVCVLDFALSDPGRLPGKPSDRLPKLGLPAQG